MKRSICLLLTILFFSTFAYAQTTAPTANKQNAGVQLPPVKKLKLPNGMIVVLMEQREVPVVSFNFRLRAGSVLDPQGREGTASLTAGLLRRGTKTKSADQIAAELDFIGGEFAATANADSTFGGAEFLTKDLPKGMELLSEILLNPIFPDAEVTKLKTQRIDGVRAAKDQAQAVIGNYFNSYLYGAHPYARPVGGDEKSLAAITRADIQKFYTDTYAPANMILAVVGDFNASEMERLITSSFGTWNKQAIKQTPLIVPTNVTGKRLLLIDKPDSTQTFYYIGSNGITRTNKDRVGIALINTLFGGRFTSRLNSELRIKTGLTYGARSSFDRRLQNGTFAISTYTRNETTEKAIDVTLDLLNKLHATGITQQELDSAKAYLKGTFPTSIESSDQLAAQLTELEFYGLDATEINDFNRQVDALTLTDANRLIKTYFPKDNYVLVLVGKRSEIEKVARKYATQVDFKSISDAGF